MANTIRAGRITGDPTKGLCDRVCIEVNRVFDGCRETANNQTYVFALTGLPPQATPPFTFTHAINYDETRTENVSVTLLDNGKSRIECDVVIPILVTFLDAHGNAYTATSTLRLHRTFVLCVPEPSVVPYTFRVFAAFASDIGNFLSDDSVSVTGCYTLLAKVIVPTDLLVPSYGACVYPTCLDCGENMCNVFTALPLFPEL